MGYLPTTTAEDFVRGFFLPLHQNINWLHRVHLLCDLCPFTTMQEPTRYYFLAPSDILPDTTLQLGQLFTSLPNPHLSRLCPPPPIPTSQIQRIQSSSPWQWSYDLSSSTSCNLSITAAALAQLIPLGPDISVSARRGSKIEFAAERLETMSFVPDRAYLDKCMQAEEVQVLLKKRRASSLYMITGVKIAHDGTKREVLTKGKEITLGLVADGTGASVLVAAQAGVGSANVKEVGETASFTGPRVVAIKIDRVVLRWRFLGTRDATGRVEPVVRGAVLESKVGISANEKEEEEEDEEEEIFVLHDYSLDDENVGESETDLAGVTLKMDQCVDEHEGTGEYFLVSF